MTKPKTIFLTTDHAGDTSWTEKPIQFADEKYINVSHLRLEIANLAGRVPNGKGDMIPDFMTDESFEDQDFKGKWICRDDVLALLNKE